MTLCRWLYIYHHFFYYSAQYYFQKSECIPRHTYILKIHTYACTEIKIMTSHLYSRLIYIRSTLCHWLRLLRGKHLPVQSWCKRMTNSNTDRPSEGRIPFPDTFSNVDFHEQPRASKALPQRWARMKLAALSWVHRALEEFRRTLNIYLLIDCRWQNGRWSHRIR